jgi:tRNA dimethylallyltransferase
MPERLTPKIIVIVGPTASGKSDLAVSIAKKVSGEVISADSRQVYKGLDIGSGKITRKEMRGVRHHLLDVASPRRAFTAADFRRLGRRAIRDILKRGKVPIVAGGTAFYINALLSDAPLPQVPPDKKLRVRLEKKTAAQLFAQLQKLDPRRARTIEKKNKRRLVRALEIVLTTGQPVPEATPWKTRKNPEGKPAGKPDLKIVKIGITPPPDILKKRIRMRLRKRLRQGMVKEVERLHANGLSWKRLEDLGLEYRYVSRYLRGLISKEEMIETIEKESWRYAKRQMNWWKKDVKIEWVKSPSAGAIRKIVSQKAPV